MAWPTAQIPIQEGLAGTSLVVQWLRLCASNAGVVGLIPGQGTKIPDAALCGQKKKKRGLLLTSEGVWSPGSLLPGPAEWTPLAESCLTPGHTPPRATGLQWLVGRGVMAQLP